MSGSSSTQRQPSSSRTITVVDSLSTIRFIPPKPGLVLWWSITMTREGASVIAGISEPVRSAEAQSTVTTRPSSGKGAP